MMSVVACIRYQATREQALARLSQNHRQYQHFQYTVNEYLQLNLYASSISKSFEKRLIEKLTLIHQRYMQWLDTAAKKTITLHLVISADRAEYDQQLSYFSIYPMKTLGVYFGGLNIAYIDGQGSDEKALKTVIHEATHGLNAHIIGLTSRMFNEGMAELFENSQIENERLNINILTSQLAREPLPLMQIFDNQQWAGYHDIYHYYYSSWAWLTFMLTESQRHAALIALMREEQIDPCSALSAGEIYQLFQDQNPMIEADFYQWQQQIAVE